MSRNTAFLSKMEDLVKQVVSYHNIPCYLIDSKVETHTNAYGENANIPVVRIVGFFEDTISKVTLLLNNEFELRELQDAATPADAFTSTGKTYQAGLKANRLELPEYKILAPHKFEIRVSSILQDVYTAMQKGLSNGAPTLPDNVKRDFYRVGAFLEMADLEFVKMRDNVSKATGNPATAPATQPVPDIPQAPRDTYVAAEPQPAPATQPEPQVENPFKDQLNGIEDKTNLETVDMSVDSFNSLAVGINNIEQKDEAADDRFLDLLTEEKPAEEKASSDGVALNIDNIETFNMNVNGLIERNTEIVREPVKEEAKEELPAGPVDENSQLTEAMLKDFVKSSKLVKEIDSLIAERAGAKINDEIDIEGDVDRLRFLKVLTLKQLTERLTENKEEIVAFAEKWIGKDNGGSFDSGICLFYLEYLLVGKKNDPAFAVEYVLKFISDNDYSARYIIPTYNSIRHADQPTSSFAHLTLK
jgi:hypothetical protein